MLETSSLLGLDSAESKSVTKAKEMKATKNTLDTTGFISVLVCNWVVLNKVRGREREQEAERLQQVYERVEWMIGQLTFVSPLYTRNRYSWRVRLRDSIWFLCLCYRDQWNDGKQSLSKSREWRNILSSTLDSSSWQLQHGIRIDNLAVKSFALSAAVYCVTQSVCHQHFANNFQCRILERNAVWAMFLSWKSCST